MSDSRRHTASSLAHVPKPGDTRSARIPVSASTLRSVRSCLAWLSNIGAGKAGAVAAGDTRA